MSHFTFTLFWTLTALAVFCAGIVAWQQGWIAYDNWYGKRARKRHMRIEGYRVGQVYETRWQTRGFDKVK